MTSDPHRDPTRAEFVYDEFGYFDENAAEWELPFSGPPTVSRVAVALPDGRSIRALRWGSAPPEVVFVHGGAQNAHTWDTVNLALARNTLCVDLPGHGHSDWHPEQDYHPHQLADDVAVAVAALAPAAGLVVGMSLGGMTSNALAARHPQLVQRLLIVDVTPGTTAEKAKHITDFVNGPQTFPSFAEILARTMQFNPTRSESSLRRGIVHNAHRLADGSWAWNYDRERRRERTEVARSELWADVEATAQPYLLVRGMAEGTVVDDADVAELLRRRPDAAVVEVQGAGHSVQGDQPLVLAELIERHLTTPL
ncbi:MAG: alpha/beta fold hydrolase [Acidimicrobiales bacterium]